MGSGECRVSWHEDEEQAVEERKDGKSATIKLRPRVFANTDYRNRVVLVFVTPVPV